MADKIPILFLHAQDGFGADAAVHADIIRQLDREKFEVHVACTGGDGRREPPSLEIWRSLPEIKLRPTRFAPSLGSKNVAALVRAVRSGAAFSGDFLALRKYVAQEGIRIVHSTERPRDASYNIALSKATGARSVVHVHVKWSKQYSLPARFGVARADAVFSISRYVTSTLLAMGRPASSIHTILNGIDPSKWDPAIDGNELRRELGVPADVLVLASVSRLFSWKGQRELIRAFALVHAVIENVRLLIVGADASEVEGGSFSDELKELASNLGVRQKVIFTGARSDVPRVMAACDVFSMPSFEEPFGLVFLEAMAMKRPVVAIDNGGTPEVVEAGETGLLSPPWDIAALAANLLTLLRDPALRARMGERGRARLLEHFTSQRMARDAEKGYEAVLARD
ncbi:MAG TPA: glycosyltransferase family 4 protein [Polyangiaceae bacterium]|jgi:glycosyltransferase involved in cell wall biosynthesis